VFDLIFESVKFGALGSVGATLAIFLYRLLGGS